MALSVLSMLRSALITDTISTLIAVGAHMTKREILTRLQSSQAELSRLLGVSRAAIAQWPDDEPIPELRQLQLEKLRPDIFGPAAPAKRKVA